VGVSEEYLRYLCYPFGDIAWVVCCIKCFTDNSVRQIVINCTLGCPREQLHTKCFGTFSCDRRRLVCLSFVLAKQNPSRSELHKWTRKLRHYFRSDISFRMAQTTLMFLLLTNEIGRYLHLFFHQCLFTCFCAGFST
jgi:hypothetical protein